MAKVGDMVQVHIGGGEKGTSLGGGQARIGIGPGASMCVPGQIVADKGATWVVRLSISLGGANLVEIPKN